MAHLPPAPAQRVVQDFELPCRRSMGEEILTPATGSAMRCIRSFAMNYPFESLPRRIFLDSCTAQTLRDYGGYIYEAGQFSLPTVFTA
jgi:hypothetical protein